MEGEKAHDSASRMLPWALANLRAVAFTFFQESHLLFHARLFLWKVEGRALGER